MSNNLNLPPVDSQENIPVSAGDAPSLKLIWLGILDRLKADGDADTLELWLKPVQLVSSADPSELNERKSFALEVPSKIFADWIRGNVFNKIQILLTQAIGSECALTIQIAEDVEMPAKEVSSRSPEITLSLPVDPAFSAAQFNPKYTFESFIEGQANRFAKAAAEGISKEPGTRFNPLFFYGDVGLGKTHLMHAVGQTICKNFPKSRVLYISSEKFINEFINSLRFESPVAFRNKYRYLDCLLIDDIQFLRGKGRSQEEFFFTFNTLFDSRKQIVISSDRPPKELGELEERLISRFEWGVVADIQPPDLETRIAILRKKAESEKMFVPEDVILFIASQVKTNIRELEGALIRMVALSSLTGTSLTVDSARSTLKDIIKREDVQQPVNMDRIQAVVAKHFNLDVKDLKSKRRTDAIAWPRQIAMYLSRTLTEHSTTEVGEHFGGKDHTTVLHACEKVKLKLAESPFISSMINKIIQEIKSTGENN